MIDYDHRPVRQVTYGLMRFAAFFHQTQFQFVTRGGGGAQRAREIGEIERGHLLQTRDLAERLVVRQQSRLEELRGPYQSCVDGKIGVTRRVVNGQVEFAGLLQLIQNVEAAPAALAFYLVARIGQGLQFAQNKTRNDQGAAEKPRADEIGDPAIDDDVGIDDERLM